MKPVELTLNSYYDPFSQIIDWCAQHHVDIDGNSPFYILEKTSETEDTRYFISTEPVTMWEPEDYR